MDIQRQAFQEWYIANHHDGDIHPNQQLLEWSEKGGFYFASSVENLWEAWQQAQKSAVPDGYVVVPREPTTHQVDYCQTMKFREGVGRSHKFEDIFVYKAMIEAQEQVG